MNTTYTTPAEYAKAPRSFTLHGAIINGQAHAVIATQTTYLPQFRRPDNKFMACVCGNVLNDKKTFHATWEAATAAAIELFSKVDGAFYPTIDGEAPYL